MWLVLCLLLPSLALARGWTIREGKGCGPVSLGQPLGEAERQLGKPISSEPGVSDPDARINGYKGGVLLLINRDGQVIGITVTAPDARTGAGLGVGSSRSQVQAALGPGLQRSPGQVAYPSSGIGFAYAGQQVERVFVFRPEQSLPLQGDRLIVPGQRVGDLKLGLPVSTVQQAWGAASETRPWNGGQTLRWSDKRVTLFVLGGKIVGIVLDTGDYVTAQGLKVGSQRSEVVRTLGPGEGGGQGLQYPHKGISFSLAGNQVTQIVVGEASR